MGDVGNAVVDSFLAYSTFGASEFSRDDNNRDDTTNILGKVPMTSTVAAAKRNIVDNPKFRAEEVANKAASANAATLARQKQLSDQATNRVNQNRARQSALQRQRNLAAQAQGRSSTILTSPLGLTVDGPTTGTKTILGS